MLPENETCAFLGIEYAWSGASVRLEDVQALHGGVRVWVPHWGPASVTQVRPGGQETKFRVLFSHEERLRFYRLCVEQDFLTIQAEDRPGMPDEARPTIVLTNSKGKKRSVAKWASIQDERFDAIYQVLLEVAERTEGRKAIPEKLRPWQKSVFWAGVILLLAIPFLSGYLLARATVATWWPDDLTKVVGLLLFLILAAPLLLAGLRWLERRKATYDRLFTNAWLLIILSSLFFAVLVAVPGFLKRVSLAVWADTAVGTVQNLSQINYLDADAGPIKEYSVTYSFQTDDENEYERRVQVTQAYYEMLEEGDSVTAHYLPVWPRYSLLDFQIETETADYALILFTVLFAIYLFVGETAVFGPTLYRIQEERL